MKKNFDWQEFLHFARQIYRELETTREVDDTLCRIGISRAYYAAYHAARNYLLELIPDFSSGIGEGSHQAVINEFLRMKDKYRRQIGDRLAFVKDMRVRADYKERCYNRRGEIGNALSELKTAIDYADKINALIFRCRQS